MATHHIDKAFARLAHLEKENAQLRDDLAKVEASRQEQAQEIDAVYAIGKIPVEQAKAIPLAQYVRTRFVHVEDFNAAHQEIECLKDAICPLWRDVHFTTHDLAIRAAAHREDSADVDQSADEFGSVSAEPVGAHLRLRLDAAHQEIQQLKERIASLEQK